MVAHRLSYLSGNADLSDVKQILDIGSWHLNQTIEFSNIFADTKIDAFEPVPDSYQLCMNKLNALDEQQRSRINVHNVALSNAIDEIPFFVANSESKHVDAGFSSMFKFNDQLFDPAVLQKEITVSTDTLDNWCKTNSVDSIDIMWIDVQGAELLVLQGAENILKSTRIIMTEVGLKPYYEGHTLKEDIDKFLLARGFKELDASFEMNIKDYEANTIYIKS